MDLAKDFSHYSLRTHLSQVLEMLQIRMNPWDAYLEELESQVRVEGSWLNSRMK